MANVSSTTNGTANVLTPSVWNRSTLECTTAKPRCGASGLSPSNLAAMPGKRQRSDRLRNVTRVAIATAGLTVLIARGDPSMAATSTTHPSSVVQPRQEADVVAELASDQAVVNRLLGKNNANLKTDERRRGVSAELLPPLRRMLTDLDQLAELQPGLRSQMFVASLQLTVIEALLGDEAAAGRVRAFAAGTESADADADHACHWLRAWYTTEATDTAAQHKLVVELGKLDRAHPDSECLALLTVNLSREAVSAEQADEMLGIVASDMKGATPQRIKGELALKREAAEQDAKVAGKPLVLTGTLVDGHPFSTADWHGKVVLVDFWATWCGPCRAELPHIQQLYRTYHDRGLEVVGISNDYDADALKSFMASAELPWPQLFDAAAAAKRSLHPITVKQQIDGIPVIYLIDRKGNLRTVNGRLNAEQLINKLLDEPA